MKKRAFKIAAFSLGVFLLASAGVFGSRYFINYAVEGNAEIDESQQLQGTATLEGDSKQVNVLLMATDRDNLHTDSMMIASYDKERQMLNIIAVPRDTRVMINGKPYKLNTAYALGKKGQQQELTIRKINEFIDLPIHYYAVVNTKGFRNIVDILGGVEIDVPMRMKYDDPEQDLHIDLYPGLQVLDGDKAEQFCRFRKGYVDQDYERSMAQQQFLKALIEQKLKPEYFFKISSIFQEISANLDTNIGIGDIATFLPFIKSLNSGNTHMYYMPGEDKVIDGVWYFLPEREKTAELIREKFLNQPAGQATKPAA